MTIANLSSGALSAESSNSQTNQSVKEVSEQSNFNAQKIKDELDKHLTDYAKIKKFLDEELPVKYATVEQLKALGEQLENRLKKLEQKGESDG